MSRFDFREKVLPSDTEAVRGLIGSAGRFSAEETRIAVELVEERLAKGPACGYHFIFVEEAGAETRPTAGYACYGPRDERPALFDLYWIAVAEAARGQGLGSRLLELTEQRALAMGGKELIAETSSREDYADARRFYEARGFTLLRTVERFYGPRDHRLDYGKDLLSEPFEDSQM